MTKAPCPARRSSFEKLTTGTSPATASTAGVWSARSGPSSMRAPPASACSAAAARPVGGVLGVEDRRLAAAGSGTARLAARAMFRPSALASPVIGSSSAASPPPPRHRR